MSELLSVLAAVAKLGPDVVEALVDLVKLAAGGASKDTIALEAEKLSVKVAFARALQERRGA